MGRVLIVDDNADLCRALMMVIRVFGVQAECATGGFKLLEYLAERSGVDLVILDYMMPDLDGLSVLRRLRAEPRTRDLSVLFFTAAADNEKFRTQAEALGAKAVIDKGISFNGLREWIEPLVER